MAIPPRRVSTDEMLQTIRAWAIDHYRGKGVATEVKISLLLNGHPAKALHPIPDSDPCPTPEPEARPEPARESSTVAAGADYRSINWKGTPYPFTEPQAEAVRLLWEAKENGTWDVPDKKLVEAAGTDSTRLGDVFRDCAAWGRIIIEGGTRGTHRFAPLN